MQGQPRSIIEGLPAAPNNSAFTLKMALLADRVPQGWLHTPGIDDGIVHARDVVAELAPLDVQFPGAVAPFTANCIATKEGRSIAVERVLDRLGPVAVAEKTVRLNRTLKV